MRISHFLLTGLCVVCSLATALPARGQTADENRPIPLDPQVRYGRLENGLTYYVRRNTFQPGLADFYIAQRVGSILEEPGQRGLAHFLEHMAFNGSRNFPGSDGGQRIVDWCETVGIRFGQNLNAYTSVDETVYNICDAPIAREGIVDSCLLILHDWSGGLLLTDEEIDKERGVIEEEWRTRQNAAMRIYEQIEEKVYKGCKYEDCLPIGNIEVVRTFPYEALRSYYKKWYRPDLQGIIVVGDIDPDLVEQKIKRLFADIPAPGPDAAKRTYYPVPDNKEPIVGIFTDKEMNDTQVELYFKHEPIPRDRRETLGAWRRYFENSIISQVLSERLIDIQQKPDAPILNSWMGEGSFLFSDTKNSFVVGAAVKEGQAREGLACIYREALRAARGGLTPAEVERAKARIASSYESAYNEREHTKNVAYVNSYVRHFLNGNVTPGIEREYTELIRNVIPTITAEELTALLRSYLTETNRVLLLTGPEKEGLAYPTEGELLQTLADVEAEQLEPFVDKVGNEPLIAQLPEPGKVVEQEPDSFGFTRWKLSNGMTVYVKPTDFSRDEVRLHMARDGGTSLFPDSDIRNWAYATRLTEEGGLGNFDNLQLAQKLAGKQVDYSTYQEPYGNGLNGSCAPRDFETLLQLVYLQFTAPRRDEEAMMAWKNGEKENIRNLNLRPETAFSDSLTHSMFLPSPRRRRFTEADIDSINYDRAMDYFRHMFSDASDFSVYIVGNVQPDSIRPYVEQYLAALPSDFTEESWQRISGDWRTGERINHFQRAQETPKSYILLCYNKPEALTLRSGMKMQMLARLLDIVYTETLREDEGGTYGASVSELSEPLPEPRTGLQIFLTTDLSKQARLMPLVYKGLDDLARRGPNADDLDKVKEFMLKQQRQRLRENSYWLSKIYMLKTFGIDSLTGYKEAVRNITAEELQQYARDFLEDCNRVEVIMEPAAGEGGAQ